MKGIPNIIHSRELTDWISSGFALDRFRTLYPHSREFSYLPFSKTALNRSRIDHFFISPNLCSTVSNVKYLPLSSSLFDHKPVLCVLGKKPNMGKSIDKSLLHITDLYEAVKFEVIYTVIDYFNIPNKSLLRDNLIELNILNKQLYGVSFILNTFPHDLFLQSQKNLFDSQILELCNTFPPLDDLLDNTCNIEADLFLEVLLNNIKNSTISFQSNYLKLQNLRKASITKDIAVLRASKQVELFLKINDLESELSRITDKENLLFFTA